MVAAMKLSIVTAVYSEEDCVNQFITEATAVLSQLPHDYEIVFVDDGSRDATVELINAAAASDPHIKLVQLSYNHGKQAAVTAGISYATGDYLIYMDPDLQDPPQEIPRFLDEIAKGYDIVFGIRRERRMRLVSRLLSETFWFVLRRFTGLNIPKGLAVMRIFNRRFADRFMLYDEQNRFLEGIFMHIGLAQGTLEIAQRDRFAGTSKFNFRRRMRLAMDAILDYSELPLSVAVKFGATLAAAGLAATLIVILLKLLTVDFQAGWPALISLLLAGFGVQVFFIGIVALYIGRIYRESKHRPLFSVRSVTNLELRRDLSQRDRLPAG